MKSLIILTLCLLTSTTINAQKTYVDPNLKAKKGLLEPGEKAPAAEAVPSPVATEKAEAEKKLTPAQLRYCSCIDYTRAVEQQIALAYALNQKGAMTWDETYKIERDAELEKYKGLIKRLEASSDIDPDEFECDVRTIEAKKPKDFKKHLDEYDRTCKFKEIERKSM